MLVVMKMRKGTIYPIFIIVLFSCVLAFLENISTPKGYMVNFCISISIISAVDFKGDFCCSMTCVLIISEIGEIFQLVMGIFVFVLSFTCKKSFITYSESRYYLSIYLVAGL